MPSRVAMRRAAARVASRRGSSITMRPCNHGCSINHNGATVVLPAPGGATSSAQPRVSSAVASSGSTSATGRSRACSRQRHVSAECRRAVERPRVAGDRDRRADPGGRSGDLLGDRSPLRGVPSLGAGLQVPSRRMNTKAGNSPSASVRTNARRGRNTRGTVRSAGRGTPWRRRRRR